jgi:hypothetical protein
MSSRYEVLTADDVRQFLGKGYVKLPGCFTRDAADEHTRHIWDRLGYRADDPETWERPSVHMASHPTSRSARSRPRRGGRRAS